MRISPTRLMSSAAVVLMLCTVLVAVLYGQSLQGWWCCDDPAILLHARQYSVWELLLDPQAYRALIPYSLQPLLSISYGLDLALFGLQPQGFFLHQLLVIVLCGWLVQRIAALWVPAPLAWAAMVLFLAGSPVAFASQYLLMRHYVDGLLFFLLALWLVLQQLLGGQTWLRWPAVAAFALAVTAKEVFVPLGLLPLLLPVATLRARWRATWPWLVVLLAYVGWRRFMLGEFLGGYQPPEYLPPVSLPLLTRAFQDAGRLLWPWSGYWLILGAVTGVSVVLWVRRAVRSRWSISVLQTPMWLGALAVMLFAPLLPLAGFPGFAPGAERYFLVPWLALSLLLVLILGWWKNDGVAGRGWMRASLVLALAVGAWVHSREVLERSMPYLEKSRVVGQFFLSASAQDAAFVDNNIAGWYVRGLLALRADAAPRHQYELLLEPVAPAALGGVSAPQPLADASDLMSFDLTDRRVYSFDPPTGVMREVTAEVPQMLHAWQAMLSRQTMGVDMRFVAKQRALHVRMTGPEGAVFFVVSNGLQQVLPKYFGLRMDDAPKGCLRVRMDLPNGLLVYSPMLHLEPAADGSGDWFLRWEGEGVPFENFAELQGSAACQ